MAWSAPMTAVTNTVWTAAQFNQHVRDNLSVTEAAVAQTSGSLIVSTAANALTYRTPQVTFLSRFEDTASTTYGDLATAGPAVTVTSGTKALIMLGGQVTNNTAGLGSRIGVTISGATSSSASDTNSYYAEAGNTSDKFQGTWVYINSSLTAGSNTFTLKYRTTAGGGTSTFGHRLIAVTPF